MNLKTLYNYYGILRRKPRRLRRLEEEEYEIGYNTQTALFLEDYYLRRNKRRIRFVKMDGEEKQERKYPYGKILQISAKKISPRNK